MAELTILKDVNKISHPNVIKFIGGCLIAGTWKVDKKFCIKYNFVETPPKFIMAELSIRKLRSLSMLIITSTDEDPSLRFESSAIVNLRGMFRQNYILM